MAPSRRRPPPHEKSGREHRATASSSARRGTRARRAALGSELATAQREIETQAAQLRQAARKQSSSKQAAESATAELRQSLQQERERTEAMARNLSPRTVGGRSRLGAAARQPCSPMLHTSGGKAAAAPADGRRDERQSGGDEIDRARQCAARSGRYRCCADRARARSRNGSAQASFMLAETYDPAILSAWGTYGTRGEVTKARELYAKAHAGGIQEAKDRLDALRQ